MSEDIKFICVYYQTSEKLGKPVFSSCFLCSLTFCIFWHWLYGRCICCKFFVSIREIFQEMHIYVFALMFNFSCVINWQEREILEFHILRTHSGLNYFFFFTNFKFWLSFYVEFVCFHSIKLLIHIQIMNTDISGDFLIIEHYCSAHAWNFCLWTGINNLSV